MLSYCVCDFVNNMDGDIDETQVAYESGYRAGAQVAGLYTISRLCIAGDLTVERGAEFLCMDVDDLQGYLRAYDAVSSIPEEEIPF